MAQKATPADIAVYGHITTRLRDYLDKNQMSPPDLSEKLGQGRGSATVYKWLKGTGGPSPKLRAKLAKVLGVSEAELTPRKPGDVSVSIVGPRIVQPRVAQAGDVLSFKMNGDGDVRIQLDVILPREAALALMQVLMECGVGQKPKEV